MNTSEKLRRVSEREREAKEKKTHTKLRKRTTINDDDEEIAR
jgi:hypothetical protein